MFHTAVALDVRFSITVRQDTRIRAAIETIDEQAWQPIPYWLSSPEVSGADVAETTYTAFTGKHALPVSADRPSRSPDPRIAARAVHHLELPRVRHGPTRTDAPVEDLDAAVQYVAELDAAGGEGGYTRVITISSPLSPGKRGDVELTAALPGLWADLDIAGPGHKPPVNGLPLPPDEAAVRAIVAESGLPKPTLWQHFGLARPSWIVENGGPRYTVEQLVNALPAVPTHAPNGQSPAATNPRESTGSPLHDFMAGVGDFAPAREPFDVLADTATWTDVFMPEVTGWSFVREERDGAELWLRPGGATSEYSARAFEHNLVVHFEDAGLPLGAGQRLTKGRVFAHLHYDGNQAEAARDLLTAAQGHATAGPAGALPRHVLTA